MLDVVREMHTTSGLLERARRGCDARRRPRTRCWTTCVSGCAEPRARAPLAGNSVAHRPRLPRPRHARRSRRTCTTGSSTCPRSRSCPAAGTRAPTSHAPAKTGGHRALADIRESIAELQLLPGGGLRAAARPGLAHSQGAEPAARHRRRLWRRGGLRHWRCRGDRTGSMNDAVRTGGMPSRAAVGVAQQVEHRVVVPGVAGSSPVTHPD